MAEDKIELKITGMTCGGCSSAVETALKSVDGVEGVTVDLQAGTATVMPGDESISSEKLIIAVKLAGYDARAM